MPSPLLTLLTPRTNRGLVRSGLIREYRFDEGSGTTVVDHSPYAKNGTLQSGVSWNSHGVVLNGTSTGYIDGQSTDTQGVGSGTVMVAGRFTSTPAGNSVLVSRRNGSTGWDVTWIQASSKFQADIFGSTSVFPLCAYPQEVTEPFLATLTFGTGTNLCRMQSGMNHITKATISGGSINAVGGATLKIGSGGTPWPGEIWYTVVYNRILSDNEIAQNYTAIRNVLTSRGLWIPVGTSLNPQGYTAPNAAAPLTIPMWNPLYPNQAVEPRVWQVPNGGTWNGFPYWMVVEGYHGDNDDENPGIFCSLDGTTWQVPTGLTNPINLGAQPGGDGNANSDNTFLMPPDGTTLYAVYGKANVGIVEQHSTNGATWSAATLVGNLPTQHQMPAVIYHDGVYYMWGSNFAGNNDVTRQTAPSLFGPWSTGVTTNLLSAAGGGAFPSGWSPWHCSINFDDGEYRAFISATNNGTSSGAKALFFCTSPDGVTWRVPTTPLLVPSASGWDGDSTTQIYQSCAVRTPSGYDVFYGTQNPIRVARTAFNL